MLRLAVARIPEPAAAGGDAAPGWMGAAERQRWIVLAAAARREFAASRALLRGLLRAVTGIADGAWDVSAEPGTAPRARALEGDIAMDAMHVSISHRLGWVAAAVSATPVGIDIECERPARSDAGERAALMLSPGEMAAWHALAPADRASALLTRWTAKEAWFKASPPESPPWDFRRIAAQACAPAHANVRTWSALPLHVALYCADARALAAAECDGLPGTANTSFWQVRHAVPAN